MYILIVYVLLLLLKLEKTFPSFLISLHSLVREFVSLVHVYRNIGGLIKYKENIYF